MSNYSKKIEMCEKLGAKQFRKAVFLVEKAKWKITKKVFPGYLKFAEKYINNETKKRIKKAKSEDEIKRIKMESTEKKMIIRKEFYNDSNANYHINKSNPTMFLYYLNINKNIHKRGLIWDLVTLPVLTAGSIATGNIPLIVLTGITGISTLVNFECINVQNYNIYRIKKNEEKLKKLSEKRLDKAQEKYGEAIDLVGKTIEEKQDVPTIEDIVNNIKTKEQAEQLKKMIAQYRSKGEVKNVSNKFNK